MSQRFSHNFPPHFYRCSMVFPIFHMYFRCLSYVLPIFSSPWWVFSMPFPALRRFRWPPNSRSWRTAPGAASSSCSSGPAARRRQGRDARGDQCLVVTGTWLDYDELHLLGSENKIPTDELHSMIFQRGVCILPSSILPSSIQNITKHDVKWRKG